MEEAPAQSFGVSDIKRRHIPRRACAALVEQMPAEFYCNNDRAF